MKYKRRLQAVFIGYAGVIFCCTAHAAVKRTGPTSSGSSYTCAVWVYFTDKPDYNHYAGVVSPRALARRRAAAFSEEVFADQPVSSKYIYRIEAAGGRLRNCFKWDNTASFDLPVDALPYVSNLPFVDKVEFVGKYRRKAGTYAAKYGRFTTYDTNVYGALHNFLAMLDIPSAHLYLHRLNQADLPGKGVRIAFFDSGFRLDHRCFNHLHQRGAIKGTWDFIDRDTSVADPDSVNTSLSHPLWSNDVHGSQVFSVVAAYDPPYYCGCAWGADFLLARTEDAYYDSLTGLEHELHVEEDNWAAAVVWAESLGVDIISSSLGYRYDFQDTIIVERNDGLVDTVVDYPKSDLDGRTTVVSRAALGAIERGIVIVNAAGNEQRDGDTSLSAPADVDGVIAVGSVNTSGSLSSFSSLGPSADGRFKPDVVAPGEQIALPDIFNPVSVNYDNNRSGTSFSTPFIAGVCALIKQAFPDCTAQQIRERLYRYCRLLSGQTAVNNRYGHGIPDALRSCMKWEDEVLFTATDTGELPLAGAELIDGQGDTIGRTGVDGIAILRLPGAKPVMVDILYGDRIRRVSIDSTPCRKTVAPCSLLVAVHNERDRPLPLVSVWYRSGSIDRNITSDTLGKAFISDFFPGTLMLVATKVGYLPSDTIPSLLGERPATVVIRLKAAQRPLFEVYPTVFRRSRHHRLIIRFAPDNGGIVVEQQVNVAIRSVNGTLIWQTSSLAEDTPLTLQWDGKDARMNRTAPGVYFLLLSTKATTYRKKFIIAE